MKQREPWKVTEARDRRARKLADAFAEWRILAEQARFPRSLVEIARTALEHEYQLGRNSVKRGGSR